MLGKAAELEAEVDALGRGGADGQSPVPPNTPLLGEHLTAVMKLKAMWGRCGGRVRQHRYQGARARVRSVPVATQAAAEANMQSSSGETLAPPALAWCSCRKLLQITLTVYTHPVLGRVALVQPLLLTACVQRLFAEGEEIVTALLEVGKGTGLRSVRKKCSQHVTWPLLSEAPVTCICNWVSRLVSLWVTLLRCDCLPSDWAPAHITPAPGTSSLHIDLPRTSCQLPTRVQPCRPCMTGWRLA